MKVKRKMRRYVWVIKAIKGKYCGQYVDFKDPGAYTKDLNRANLFESKDSAEAWITESEEKAIREEIEFKGAKK
jgi:hypothetical protein